MLKLYCSEFGQLADLILRVTGGLLRSAQFTTITCNLIAVVNVRTTEEAEPATYGTIKKNQQQALALDSVNSGASMKAQLWFYRQ